MNDKELAGAVVALGVVTDKGSHYEFPNEAFVLSDELLVRDWRVAGALMEKIPGDELRILTFGQAISSMTIGDTISRAIIESCVEALT